MPFWMVACLWTLTFLDKVGVTPRGLSLFAVTLIIGIAIGVLI